MWAIQHYGFDAVISPRFGDIFRNNCTKNGLVPVVVPRGRRRARIWAAIEADPTTRDHHRRRAPAASRCPPSGIAEPFPLDDATQHRFLNGLDDIGITLSHADEITDYEKSRGPPGCG